MQYFTRLQQFSIWMTVVGGNCLLLCGFDGIPPLALFNSLPRRWTMWRQAGPWGQPLTTSETSTSTKDSLLSLQPALRGTVRHCEASLPPSNPSPHRHTRSHHHAPSPTVPLLFPSTSAPCELSKNCWKKKSLYFYKASYFYCMLSS